jgi:hypothetical protein
MMWSRDDLLAKKLLLVSKSIADAQICKTFSTDTANLIKQSARDQINNASVISTVVINREKSDASSNSYVAPLHPEKKVQVISMGEL